MGLIRRHRVTQRQKTKMVVSLRSPQRNEGFKRIDGHWSPKVLKWHPRTGKRSVGRPPTRWTDDIKQFARSRWKQAAQNRGVSNALQKIYVHQWKSIGSLLSSL
ncbi:jg7720 [Pararge aegeria aegeria]|uniref:Jg7720 protein n=1 Tax=Pararge aegeria aegeria TaxID=348720 RepID=A0A8S4RAL9_9NEOP|nr:jg7720 [Pararge aegeria aegeria]